MPREFRGSYAVIVTPFTADGSAIDIPAWKRFLDWQIELGRARHHHPRHDRRVPDGHRRGADALVETTVKHVDGRIPVLVGTMNAYYAACGALQPRGRGCSAPTA